MVRSKVVEWICHKISKWKAKRHDPEQNHILLPGKLLLARRNKRKDIEKSEGNWSEMIEDVWGIFFFQTFLNYQDRLASSLWVMDIRKIFVEQCLLVKYRAPRRRHRIQLVFILDATRITRTTAGNYWTLSTWIYIYIYIQYWISIDRLYTKHTDSCQGSQRRNPASWQCFWGHSQQGKKCRS